MTAEFVTGFLTSYLHSLAERTREEVGGTKFGFDWVIYNLGLAEDWTPIRLPFVRAGSDTTAQTKTEAEFGIDFSFLSPDRSRLRIFVLKDEVLTYSAFTREDFDRDLRMASLPDLAQAGLESVTDVEVILAYNKDEHADGVQLYEQFVANQPKRIAADRVTLHFDRWNLTALVERVRDHLLTPNLMPQRFFGLFSYICSQVSDFRHGSDEWTHQLLPNWRRFLDDVLSGPAEKRRLDLIPVALLILQKRGAQTPAFETGWIDLIEWAMLRLWRSANDANTQEARQIVANIWVQFYVFQLRSFFDAYGDSLATKDSLELRKADYDLGALANAYVAFWYLGRIGILAYSTVELINVDDLERLHWLQNELRTLANFVVAFLNANSACFRPVIDLNHIELFLIWQLFFMAERKDAIRDWLGGLRARLQLRRHKISGLQFIADHNSWELAFEDAALKGSSDDATPKSSHLLLMLMECATVLREPDREAIIDCIYTQLVEGKLADGERSDDVKTLDLLTWVPPENWESRILSGPVNDGESIVVSLFSHEERPPASLTDRLKRLIETLQTSRPFTFTGKMPLSVLALACLKHRSPLPPFYWRQSLAADIQNPA